jgi:hypothetical protein
MGPVSDGRAMCIKLAGLRCGICRDVAMMPICAMQSEGFQGTKGVLVAGLSMS